MSTLSDPKAANPAIQLVQQLQAARPQDWRQFFVDEIGVDPAPWLSDQNFQVVNSEGIDTSGMDAVAQATACQERKIGILRDLLVKAGGGVEHVAPAESAVNTEPAEPEVEIDFAAEAKKKMEARQAKAEAETGNAKTEEQAKEIASLQANLSKVEELNGALSNSVKELEAKVANLEKVNASIQGGMKVILDQL